MTKRFHESGGTPAKSLGNGVFMAKIIQPGWNASGTRYYSESLLQEYGPATFREGRPCFANHPTEEEFNNGRDITKIWGRLASDSEFVAEGEDGPGLYAQVKVRPEYVDFIEDMKDSIGMSIFATGDGGEGEAEGKRGLIVESFNSEDPYTSVDFVVAAGAGGKVQRMLESYVPTREALSNTRREELSNLVKDAYNNPNGYIWVRDFDDENGVVYFDVESDEGYSTFQQTYTVTNDVAVQLDGERQEVRSVTSYVPIGENHTTKENEGMTPEEKAELATMVATAVAEALKPTASDPEETTAASPAEVAKAVREADLPKASEERVFESLAEGATLDDVTAAITREKAFVEALKTEVEVEAPGRVRESHTGETHTFVSAWSN